MPLRKEIRKLYGAEWRKNRARIIAVLGNKCSLCGRVVEDYINLCHTNHDPKAGNLVALMCASCHGKHDSSQRYRMRRRMHARRVGQLWILPEVEWCVFPEWMIPRKVLQGQQMVLF